MEELIQDMLDDLETIGYSLRRTQDADLIYLGAGHVINIGSELKMLADLLGLDVDVRTPID